MAIAKLSDDEIHKRLGALPHWSLDQGKLHRELKFKDFIAAFGFMAKIAIVAEKQEHHPEWFNVWNTVRIHLSTHEAGGISERDFELAVAIDAHVG